jgi:hypothetical protein
MSKARTTLRALAKKLGMSTSYHVAAVYTQDSHMSESIISMTITVKPWLHVDNYAEIVAYVKTQATRCVDTPNITSVTRLGT